MPEYSDNNSLRIIATYERRPVPGACDKAEYMELLRVDGKGLIPRAGPEHFVRVIITGDPVDYCFPVPASFNRAGYFIMKSSDLPFAIPYGKDATIAIMEKRREEKLLAKALLRYRTI